MVTANREQLIATIRAGIEALRSEPDQCFELRAPKVPGRGKCVAAGYFDDTAKMAEAALRLEERGVHGVYMLLNPANPALLARCYNRVVDYAELLTSDHDITRRAWLPVDVDPVRPAGISSNDEELEHARRLIIEVEQWMNEKVGEPPAVRACSGNGWHGLWQINLPNDPASLAIVKGLIDEAARKFNNDRAHVDGTVANAARIWKAYGTRARKGDEVERLGRVHRRAYILEGGF